MNKRNATLCLHAIIALILLCMGVYRIVGGTLFPKAVPEPTATPQLKAEIQYKETLEPGTPVFERIISIKPVITEFSTKYNFYSDFFCECRTEYGKTVFVYISAADYKTHFYPELVLSIGGGTSQLIQRHFADARLLHGIVRATSDYSSKSIIGRSEPSMTSSVANRLVKDYVTTATLIEVTGVD